MTYPQTTALYIGLFGLMLVILSIQVVAARVRAKVHHGDGGDTELNRAIRSHANFAEYVPLTLVIVALIEAGGASDQTVHSLLAPLLIARAMHPIGMRQPVASLRQYAWRASSTTITWLVLVAGAALLLWQGYSS
jgi:uncharacterized membrane protein YecN with MAPEG domain